LAYNEQTRYLVQHDDLAFAAKASRAEPRRKYALACLRPSGPLLGQSPEGGKQRFQGPIGQYMRDNGLSNRIFASYKKIVIICCEAWTKLIDQLKTHLQVFLKAYNVTKHLKTLKGLTPHKYICTIGIKRAETV